MDRIDEPGNTEMPSIPAITTEQMIDIDRAMVDDYGIDLTRMMENAVRSLASLARTRFLDGDPTDKRVAVLAGPGGNGLVCARRLSAWGASVEVHMSKPAGEITGVPAEQFPIFHRMDVPVHQPGPESTKEPDLTGADLVIDALLGYRLQGAPRGHAAILIDAANQSGAPVLWLDVPSGVYATTGDTPGALCSEAPQSGHRPHLCQARHRQAPLSPRTRTWISEKCWPRACGPPPPR